MVGFLDAADPGAVRDPYPEFARLRRQSPVLRRDSIYDGAPASYIVYRHEDVTRVLRDGATFSSAVIADGMREVWGRKIIVGMDAPDHQHHRALVSVAFRQRTLARWEESLVGRVVEQLIDQFVDRGQVDLAAEYTFGFPAKVISGVLGLPEEDYQQFQQWAVGIITVFRDWDYAVRCSNELRAYLEHIVEDRRATPRDDLITDLVTAELDGEKLDDEEIYSFLRMLLPAGIETTYRSSGNLLYLLLTHPEQLDAVRADRSLIPQAIEEGLRYESPVLLTPRLTTRQTELSGVAIPTSTVVRRWSRPRTGTPRFTTTRRRSTSSATRTSTCRSGPALISVSECTSLVWKLGSRSTHSSTAFPAYDSTKRRPTNRTYTSKETASFAAQRPCPSCGIKPDAHIPRGCATSALHSPRLRVIGIMRSAHRHDFWQN
jgi:cytochrome P450